MSEKGRVDMAIIEGTNSDGTKYYQYQQPDREILRKRFSELLERLEELVKCLPELNFDVEDLAINGRILGDIIVRVDKRSDYFLIFHEQTHISEIKKAALYAYWILKLKPLSVVSPIIEKRTRYSYINETFALFILYGVLREKASRLDKEFSPSEEYTRKIAYAFKYWNISKEAVILIAETLCEEYC